MLPIATSVTTCPPSLCLCLSLSLSPDTHTRARTLTPRRDRDRGDDGRRGCGRRRPCPRPLALRTLPGPGRRPAGGRRGAATWSGPRRGGPGGGEPRRGQRTASAAAKPDPSPRRAAAVPVPARMLLPLPVRMLVLLLSLSQAAPKDGTVRLDPGVQQQPLPNPFQPGQEQLRLLRNYLQGLEKMEKEPEHMTREQVLLYLFALHDYDQSGQLDGLELLSMLTEALAPGAADFPIANPVILVVDEVLEMQDLNGDGLMTPAELINFPGEAPRHTEPREPLEPQDVGRQSLLAKSPSRQELQEALDPREDGGGVEAKRESSEPVQEAGGQAEAEKEAPGPRAEAGGQVEARDLGKEAEELPGETLESRNTPNEVEGHVIQLENDEI